MAVTPVSVPNSFSPSTVAASASVNANFTSLVNAFNNGTMGVTAAASGFLYLPGGILIQWQKLSAVAADGSAATAATFTTAFPTNCWGVFTGISDSTAAGMFPKTNSETTTGCNVTVNGGYPGQTCNVWLFAIGN